MKTFWNVLFVLLLAIGSVELVKQVYKVGFQGGFEWGFRSVSPASEESKPTEI
jgi:hypothetical protein